MNSTPDGKDPIAPFRLEFSSFIEEKYVFSTKKILKHSDRSKNTKTAYAQAINHYRDIWRGFLPASDVEVGVYLACYADTLSVGTLRLRLAAIAAWHNDHGFRDPTKTDHIKQIFNNIRLVSNKLTAAVEPLRLEHLSRSISHLEHKLRVYECAGDTAGKLRCIRDKALFLIGFWRGFRNYEISALQVENVTFHEEGGMTCYIPSSDDSMVKVFHTPSLKNYCPAQALNTWLKSVHLQRGPVFRKIDRWGMVSSRGLAERSINPIIDRIATEAGLEGRFTSHSFRSGFAEQAKEMGWDAISIFDYVGLVPRLDLIDKYSR